ncbi:hypothetical protein Ancab_005035 [Ancistrocladus abbreviatus]
MRALLFFPIFMFAENRIVTMGSSTWLFSLFYLVSLTAAQPDFSSYFCFDTNGNYTNNSTYQKNLNTLLSSITSNTQINYGFYNFSAGQDPDKVYGIGLCRGDASVATCHSCLNNSATKLVELCPVQKEAIGWYDKCMLRYSNSSIFGVEEESPSPILFNTGNVSDVEQFNQKLGGLLSSLQTIAASGDSRRKFATGEANVSNFEKTYALMQCTPDLSRQDCFNCLGSSINEIPNCCSGSKGAQVLKPSCILRYEIYLFYDSANAPSPPPPPPPSPTTDTRGHSSNTAKVAIIVAVPSIISVFVVTVFCCYLRRRRKTAKKVQSNDAMLLQEDEISTVGISTVESLQFDFGTIRAATENFCEANKLGRGGFGAVYKGKLPDGREIAVKRLARNSGQGENEFKNEVQLLAKLQHRNLVRLLGFCLKEEERLLIYEFVPNSSLDHFIFDGVKREQLDWEKRYKIIGGVARGVLYLHEDSRLRIIHRDLKASNILLDAVMNPKISDFGMARLFQVDQTHADTRRVVGTYGYMAPEYALHGLISVKSDVYSFGVLVLEIVSGQRNSVFQGADRVEDLISYVWRNWREGTALNVVDPLLAGSRTEIMRCIHIGLLCVQENEADRPTMSSVVVMLSSHSLTLPMPSDPAYVPHHSISVLSDTKSEDDSRLIVKHQTPSKSKNLSVDEDTISELHPR